MLEQGQSMRIPENKVNWEQLVLRFLEANVPVAIKIAVFAAQMEARKSSGKPIEPENIKDMLASSELASKELLKEFDADRDCVYRDKFTDTKCKNNPIDSLVQTGKNTGFICAMKNYQFISPQGSGYLVETASGDQIAYIDDQQSNIKVQESQVHRQVPKDKIPQITIAH